MAQVRSFQEHRGDLIKLSLITGHTGSSGGRLLTGGCATEGRIGGRGGGGEKEKGKVERTTEEAYLQPGHTHTHTSATGRE